MKQRPFKVGDRVEHNGKVGTILSLDPNIAEAAVEFDEEMGGHSLSGECENGYGWYCVLAYLTLIKAKSTKFVEVSDDSLKTKILKRRY